MMTLSRRTVLYAGLALVPAAIAGKAAWPMLSTPSPDAIAAVLQHHFGAEIAGAAATQKFARDASRLLQAGLRVDHPDNVPDTFEFHIVTLFLQSTTVLAHLKNGAALEHFGVFHPDLAPCQSQLVVPI